MAVQSIPMHGILLYVYREFSGLSWNDILFHTASKWMHKMSLKYSNSWMPCR